MTKPSRLLRDIKTDVPSLDESPFVPWQCESKNIYKLSFLTAANQIAPIIKRPDDALAKAD